MKRGIINLSKIDDLVGKLVSFESENGEDTVGIVKETNTDHITLTKCSIWEQYKIYVIHPDVTITLNRISPHTLIIYSNFIELNQAKLEQLRNIENPISEHNLSKKEES